jgi:hypothetical protein
MKPRQVNINFKKMGKAFREHVRKKAMLAGSTIIYKKNGQLIEEDPATSKKTVLKANLKAS